MTSMEELTYEWPPHVGNYEARFFGFTLIEAIIGVMGFLLVVATGGGLPVGVLVGVVALLFVRRLERLGGVAIPLYLYYRARAAASHETLELPLITAQMHDGVVEIEDWHGDTVAVIE